jgi:hypothetical protein
LAAVHGDLPDVGNLNALRRFLQFKRRVYFIAWLVLVIVLVLQGEHGAEPLSTEQILLQLRLIDFKRAKGDLVELLVRLEPRDLCSLIWIRSARLLSTTSGLRFSSSSAFSRQWSRLFSTL